jgi:hypothetical protein
VVVVAMDGIRVAVEEAEDLAVAELKKVALLDLELRDKEIMAVTHLPLLEPLVVVVVAVVRERLVLPAEQMLVLVALDCHQVLLVRQYIMLEEAVVECRLQEVMDLAERVEEALVMEELEQMGLVAVVAVEFLDMPVADMPVVLAVLALLL